jgi:hypothetical protein
VTQREVHQGPAGPEHKEESVEREGKHAAIMNQAGRKFNVDKVDGVSRRHMSFRTLRVRALRLRNRDRARSPFFLPVEQYEDTQALRILIHRKKGFRLSLA